MLSYLERRKNILLVILLFSLMSGMIRIYFYPDIDLAHLHLIYFLVLFSVLLVLWEFILFTGRILDGYIAVETHPNLRVTVQVIITYLFAITLQLVVFKLIEKPIHAPPGRDEVDIFTPAFALFRTIVFNLIYFGSFYFKEWKFNLVRSERLQRKQAEASYNILRNQLNPHFLFNALTSLNSLIFENQQLASDFLQQLSKVYRYTLQNKSTEAVSLTTEMDFIANYISLLKTRFGEGITFQIEIDETAHNKGIVPLTTQILIENAVKHNVISPSQPLHIKIHSTENTLSITNSVNLKKRVESSNKQGLTNLKALYKYLISVPVEIVEDSTSFTVKIPLI